MPSATGIKPRPAAPPLGGLIATLGITNESARWMNPTTTVDYRPEGCYEGVTFDLCEITNFTPADGPSTAAWKPYGISVIAPACSTLAGDEDNSVAHARRALNAVTEQLIGREFWDGDMAQAGVLINNDPWPNSYLADWTDPSLDNLSAGGPVDIVQGISCLDGYLASNNGGQQGAIHLTPQALVFAHAARAVYREGGKFYSPNGNYVIASPGYTGSGSSSHNVGSHNVWAYATDIPRIHLGEVLAPVKLLQTVDRHNNTASFLAQRGALVEWERCRHAAVQLDIIVCDTGGS